MVSIIKFKDYLIVESAEEAEALIKRKIDQIEQKLKLLFQTDKIESGEIQKFGQSKEEATSSFFDDLNLESLEKSQFSKTYKSIKLIFSDDEYRYDTIFTIKLEDAMPKEGEEFNPENLKECQVEFKRYSLMEGSELMGDTEKTIQIDDINETLFEELLLEIEKDYPKESGEEFSIETE